MIEELRNVPAGTNAVDSPSEDYSEMAHDWALADALMGGTKAMREAGELYLPRETKEDQAWYLARLQRSVLFPGFARAIRNLTGKAFASGVTIKDASGDWADWVENIDMAGNTLPQFCEQVFSAGLMYGHTTVLAEYPKVPPTATLFEERNQLNARPYLLHRDPTRIIGWRSQIVNNQSKLTRVRIREDQTIYLNDWDDDGDDYQIRVLELGSYKVYRTDGHGNWYLAEEGPVSIADKIPLVPIYFEKTGEMTSRMPMRDLAWTNVAHWQSYSDQRTILRVARLPIFCVSGASEDELGGALNIGPNSFIALSNPQAKVSFIEHTGKAIDSGRQDCMDLEERMNVQSSEPLMSRPGSQTATGRSIDARDAVSPMSLWVSNFEHCINRALELMAEYAQSDNAPTIQMTRDFGILGNVADLDTLFKSRQSGEISRDAYLEELKRRGVLTETFDIEADAELAAQTPPAPPVGGGFGGQGSQPNDMMGNQTINDPSNQQ